MDSMFASLTFLQATAPAGAEQGGQSLVMTGVTFGLVILIFYFLIIRPQNKKQKETEKMLAAIKKGDKVTTIGGLHGVVDAIDETKNTVFLRIHEGEKLTLEFNRSAIAALVNPPAAKKDEATPAAKKSTRKTSKAAPAPDAPSDEKK